jgi:hypothetical protein
MSNLSTRDIPYVEILRLGRWQAQTGPITVTQADLDALLATHEATKSNFVPRIKLGHNEAQRLLTGFLGGLEREDGRPAAGWIANLRQRGTSLFADFLSVPARLADMIEAGAWADRSVEIDSDREIAGRRYPLVLRAVALLGETPAAIGGLNDFAKLYASSGDCPSLAIRMAAGEPGTPEDLPGDDPDPQPPARGTTPDGGDTMKITLSKELLETLGLPEDATEEQAQARMLELAANAAEQPPADDPPADPAQDPAPATPPADPPHSTGPSFDITAAVAALDGLRTALTGTAPPAQPAAIQMSAGEVEALKRVAELESRVATREAEQRVALDLSDNDQGVIPPSVRDRMRPHLIKMAASGEAEDYEAVLSSIGRVRLAERGTAKAGPLSSIELSDEERRICREHGMDFDEFRKAKAERLGIAIEA